MGRSFSGKNKFRTRLISEFSFARISSEAARSAVAARPLQMSSGSNHSPFAAIIPRQGAGIIHNADRRQPQAKSRPEAAFIRARCAGSTDAVRPGDRVDHDPHGFAVSTGLCHVRGPLKITFALQGAYSALTFAQAVVFVGKWLPCRAHHPVSANRAIQGRRQIGRFWRDFRPPNSQVSCLCRRAAVFLTILGCLSLHLKIPFPAVVLGREFGPH